MYDVIIIGSGPAGYTAALYTSRAFLKTLLLSGLEVGGQLTTTTAVDNFPGFPDGILGPKLVEDMKKQVERFGTEIQQRHVSSVKRHENTNTLIVETEGKLFEGRTIIIATGASAQYLGLPSEQTFAGKGVSACATCDGFFFKEKHVVVVGGGDAAMEEANFLTRFASKLTLLVRSDALRASKIMQERVKANPKITIMWNTEVVEVVGDSKMTGLKLKNNKTNEMIEIQADGLFVAIGHKPNTELFQGKLELDEVGYIVTKAHSTATSVDGVYAGGDVADHVYRQAISAAGTGCMAALDAERFLSKNH